MNEPTSATFRSLDHLSGGVAAHPEEATGLREQLQQLESQIAAVRDLHVPRWENCINACCSGEQCKHRSSVCEHDYDEWPCSTIAVLDGVQAQGEQQ